MTNIRIDSAFSTDGYTLSRLTPTSGPGQSYLKEVLRFEAAEGDVISGIWKADPGEYRHPGSENGETFVVISGGAELLVAGHEPISLRAGSIVEIPPDTPTAMTVHETLHKVAIIVPRG